MDESRRRAEIIADLTGPDGPFPIERVEVAGVELLAYTRGPRTISEVIAAGRRWGDRVALTYEDEHYSWTEYSSLAGRFASVLVKRFGIQKGDRVAIAMRNYPEWVIAFAAAVRVGAVCVPLNAWWSGVELAHALEDCGAVVLVADQERAGSVQRLRAELPALADLRAVVEVRPGDHIQGDEEWSALLAGQVDEFDPASVTVDPDDAATILYTSGTTGRPKGSVATHRAHLTTMLNMRVHGQVEAQLAKERGTPSAPLEQPTCLIPGPLFHVSYLPRVVAAAVTGAHLVLMYKWSAPRALELIEREGVDTLVGVPTVVQQLLDEVELRGSAPPTLRTLSTAGAQSTGVLIGRIGTVLRSRVGSGTGYGMTETCGAMIMIGSHDYFRFPQSVGRALPTSQVRVVGADGSDVVEGDIGEAWFKGPNVTRGYWNQDSDAFTADGWLRTGDLVRRDRQGLVFIVDRIKDVVIRAGENVYCSEVEEALSDHPAVEESTVLGVPHELWGEEVVAIVRLRPDATVSVAELRRHALDRLAAFKVPTQIRLGRDPLPRNAVGKVLKRDLRTRFLGQPIS